MKETPPLRGINSGRSLAIANTPTDPAVYDVATSAAIRHKRLPPRIPTPVRLPGPREPLAG